MKNDGQPIRDSVPWNSRCTKILVGWTTFFFLVLKFGRNSLKKTPCIIHNYTYKKQLPVLHCSGQYSVENSSTDTGTVQIRFLSAAIKRQVELKFCAWKLIYMHCRFCITDKSWNLPWDTCQLCVLQSFPIVSHNMSIFVITI